MLWWFVKHNTIIVSDYREELIILISWIIHLKPNNPAELKLVEVEFNRDLGAQMDLHIESNIMISPRRQKYLIRIHLHNSHYLCNDCFDC